MPKLGSLRKGFSRSARKSAREILHSIRTERHFPFQPITSGVSPLAQDCSESTTPQRYFLRSHCSARRTSCWWVTICFVPRTLPVGKYLQCFHHDARRGECQNCQDCQTLPAGSSSSRTRTAAYPTSVCVSASSRVCGSPRAAPEGACRWRCGPWTSQPWSP